MMRVIRDGKTAEERVLVLGTFDGVHRGHRELLETGLLYARKRGIGLRACSFDRHPLAVLRPERAPKLLTTLPEKAALMARIGADELQLFPFSREMADMEPADFLRMLRETVRLRAVAAGWNYTFGRGGKGDAALLRKDGAANGYDVLIVPAVKTADGTAVSSSLIRGLLEEGRIEEAEKLLGHPWTATGRIAGEETDERYRLRIPAEKAMPAKGRYAILTWNGKEEQWAEAEIPDGAEGVFLISGRTPGPEGSALQIRRIRIR